jgi:hypothetical protein
MAMTIVIFVLLFIAGLLFCRTSHAAANEAALRSCSAAIAVPGSGLRGTNPFYTGARCAASAQP